VANELFAMASSVSKARAMREDGHPDAANAEEIADLFCRGSRRTVQRLFHDLWHNDDVLKYKVAQHVLDGEHVWLEEGILKVTGAAKALEPEGSGAAGASGAPRPTTVGTH
jgi:hypothetical protein